MIFESLNHNGEKKMEAFIAGSFLWYKILHHPDGLCDDLQEMK